MQIPQKLPGLKWLTAVVGIYGIIWIGLEGELWRSVLLAVGVTAVSLLYLWQKYLGGRVLSAGKWLGLTAVSGLLFGLGSGLFILLFMAVKTGLHDHGPEFSLAELEWVARQIPLWTGAGILIGLGLGMIGLGKRSN
ncbi:MAG TPA: hypothetical protein EYP41_20930 [Anaerolineae bacterium]|nr:hypothetical protein [Anaerolineae bacterium]HIP72588.1 hypothetical protein [Anaerolineae bacterium]